MRHQRADAQALRLLAADQHAVGAFVGHDFGGESGFRRGLPLIQGVDHAHDVAGRRVLQREDLHVLIPDLVDALDDAHHAVHVAGAVGDDQNVGGRVGGQVRVRRLQRPQDRHELRRGDVSDVDHLRHDLIGGPAHAVRQIDRGDLASIGIRHDLHDIPRRHGNETVHLQHREKCLVKGGRRHRRRGEHRHLRAHARVEDEVLTGRGADRLGDLGDVRVLEVRRDALRLLRGRLRLLRGRRLLRGCQRSNQRQRERAACEKPKTSHYLFPRKGRRAGSIVCRQAG